LAPISGNLLLIAIAAAIFAVVWFVLDDDRRLDGRNAAHDPMIPIPSSERLRPLFGVAAALAFAFSGLFFVGHDRDLGFGMLAFGLCFLSFALTSRWTAAVERLRRPER
jgi:hypothetical protein